MSRLPALTARQVVQALRRAGFVADRQRGSHLFLFHEGRRQSTVVPMHGGDLKRGLLKGIIKQAGLTEEEFRELL
jgi:predicted RNA binding protein YcfA (HicA-like mRNA interferase family)